MCLLKKILFSNNPQLHIYKKTYPIMINISFIRSTYNAYKKLFHRDYFYESSNNTSDQVHTR